MGIFDALLICFAIFFVGYTIDEGLEKISLSIRMISDKFKDKDGDLPI